MTEYLDTLICYNIEKLGFTNEFRCGFDKASWSLAARRSTTMFAFSGSGARFTHARSLRRYGGWETF